LVDQDLMRCRVQILVQESGSSITSQAAQNARSVPYEVGDPILDVRRDWPGAEEAEGHDVERAEGGTLGRGNVAHKDVPPFPNGANPA
jgi:hypothetical protein